VRRKFEWIAGLRNVLLAGLMCCMLVSCGDSDDSVSPTPLPTVTSLSDLFGQVLLDANGDTVQTATIEDKSVVAIYFEGYWCTACAAFTPLLLSVYEELTLDGKSFEVVLVSFAVDRAELLGHMDAMDMLWLAVPPEGGIVDALAQRYAVQFIPTLVVVDGDGNTITLSGRDDLAVKGAQAYDDWLASVGGN